MFNTVLRLSSSLLLSTSDYLYFCLFEIKCIILSKVFVLLIYFDFYGLIFCSSSHDINLGAYSLSLWRIDTDAAFVLRSFFCPPDRDLIWTDLSLKPNIYQYSTWWILRQWCFRFSHKGTHIHNSQVYNCTAWLFTVQCFGVLR